MQQRQLRLGDILDDYCPRERRLTNHAVVAMVGDDVKQTRCTTCDAEHEYKHAKVPRQRRKSETPAALYAQVAAGGPKRVVHDAAPADGAGEPANGAVVPHEEHIEEQPVEAVEAIAAPVAAAAPDEHAVTAAAPQHEAHHDDDVYAEAEEDDDDRGNRDEQDGPIHRRLIRASLPRQEGQQPPTRPIPEFTIRQPGGRPNRFRPRHQHGVGGGGNAGHQFGGNRSNGNVHGGPPRGMRSGGGGSGRPPQGAMAGRRHNQGGGGGRKRSK
jgi:Ni/Co efflux regulator RcnB